MLKSSGRSPRRARFRATFDRRDFLAGLLIDDVATLHPRGARQSVHPHARCALLYKALPAAEARRILRWLEFHYTPKHASWLNMVEIEIGVLRSQCLDRRIESRDRLLAEVAAWEGRRNASGARIKRTFQPPTNRKAPHKFWAGSIL
jgi:hypothetical protein